MSKVHILPPEIVSKIAAGEVIERPASCIKELLENALDAQTKSIELYIKDAGKTSIILKDTGTGIEPDDIEKIFIRHSTSKIQEFKDLFSIRSLGFRGEALYSIASISDIRLRSKTNSSDTGWEVHLQGGKKLDVAPINMNIGTEIDVRELFFNTPARKKFLKSDTTELQQILNLFIPYTLLYHSIRFHLNHNDKTLLDLPATESYISRLEKTLNIKGGNIIEEKKDFLDENILIHLLLGDINIQRPRKDMQFIFINNRPVQNHFISRHINEVYNLIFPRNVKPFFLISLTLPSENIDVNIHPTKREVKIKNEYSIIPLLRGFCEHTLMSKGKPKGLSQIIPTVREPSSKNEYTPNQQEKQITFSFKDHIQNDLKNKLLLATYIGTFIKKYLLFEVGQSLIIIDQHSAQERITYEQLIKGLESSTIEVQKLLTPFVLPLTPQEMISWERLKGQLEVLGLQTTKWGKETIALHSHPNLIKNPELALRNILSEQDITNFDIDTIIRHACRGSFMAGDILKPQEIEYLRKKLVECSDPFTCPHGRPTAIEIKDTVLEREFLRK